MALKLDGITASYPGAETHHVLSSIDLAIADEGCVAVVGPSGSGKSTLGRIMNGLLKPRAGTIELDGQNIHTLASLAEARRAVGLLMQQPDSQLFGMTVGEDIRFGPLQAGCSPAECQERMGRAMEQVGLDRAAFVSRSPFSLSGGERRRVALAGLLAMEPRHLVLDEPAAGLDPGGRSTIEAVVTATARRIGVVLLTADLPLAARLADRIVLLDAGTIAFDGKPLDAVQDRALLSRLRLLAPVGADVLAALLARGAPVAPVRDLRPSSVLAAIGAVSSAHNRAASRGLA